MEMIMNKLSIYVDFDDCLCETARYFSRLVSELYNLNVPYENIKNFNLKKSFSLSDEKFENMMIKAHEPEELLSYEETPGAVETVNEWITKGYDVKVITGRPASAFDASRKWLNLHGLERVKLFCLDKYGRSNFMNGSEFTLKLEDFYKMSFDFAVEDSPLAFKVFEKFENLKVLVVDRPWNKECEFKDSKFKRCFDWNMIKEIVN